VNTICKRILVLVAALAFLSPAVLPQSQKAAHLTQEDRIKKLEDRADEAEKAASVSAMEKDYITRAQKLYESYYQKTSSLQMWTLAIVGLLLIAVFGLVVRFSVNLFEQRTKLATADATAQMRNEHGRILAKEVQKLWDSNAADTKKLKESLTAQIALLEQNLKDRSDFEIQFVQGIEETAGGRLDDCAASFRQALSAYKSCKPRNLIEAKVGATTIRHLFESLQKQHGDRSAEKTREELANPLYDGLEEELALAALQSPWLTPLVNERSPTVPEPPAPAAVAEPRPAPPTRGFVSAESDLPLDDEADSCRLITT
jgi:hypothetical protein